MSAVQKLRRDRFRSQAYAKAAQALRAHGEPIASGAQAKGIPGIGSGMANRIDVILATGELNELEELKKDSDVIALRELRSVWDLVLVEVHGIGAVRAAEFVERGIRSLAHLREASAKNQVHLDAAQVIGLRHCEEFMKRIPYAEMKEHHDKLEACRLSNPKLLLTVCGSYRRGRPDCGDIDVLISHPEYTTAKRDANAGGKLLHAFVESLKHAGYVTADLAFGNTKFMGVCRLSGEERLHRRLDIRCLPHDQYHFGLGPNEWAQRTLPEFLLMSMQDSSNRKKSIAATPWQKFELSIAEVQLEGEVNLIGKKDEPMFQFDIDLGMRVDVEKKVVDRPRNDDTDYWPGIAQIVHFDNENLKPPIITRLQELPEDVAPEVNWYLQEGMGRQFIWHGLARWHAYAVQKWLKQERPPTVEDPRECPLPAPSFPPFLAEARRRYEDEIRQILLNSDDEEEDDMNPSSFIDDQDVGLCLPAGPGQSHALMNWRMLSEAEGYPEYVSPPVSDDDDFDPSAPYEFSEGTFERKRKGAPPKMKKFGRYPFLPSMLAGLGGPSKDWLPPKEHAIGHPEWFQNTSKSVVPTNGVTHLDHILEKARKRREELAATSAYKLTAMRAADLCLAIENGDAMKAFAKLDHETASCPHPDTGRCAAHYCIAKDSHEMLRMVLEARADPDARDSFGQTALMMAAKQGDEESAKMLLEAGADATLTDSLNRTASEMVKVLQAQEEEENPLRHWREKMAGEPIPDDPAKKSKNLKALIDDRERPKKYGVLLLDALVQRDLRTAEAAMEAGADVNLPDDRGDAALLLIVKSKWKDSQGLQSRLVNKVFKAGASLDFQNLQGNSALHFASHRGSLELINVLLGLRANPRLTNSEGNTPLMYAAHSGHEEVCAALLEAAAPVDVKNRAGLTAQTMAERKGFKSCAALLHAYALAPKQGDEVKKVEAKRKDAKPQKLDFDYSKWDSLEREMREDEEEEQTTRMREASQAVRRPMAKFEDLGPEAFGLPADTPWPPDASTRKKGPFDYGHWDKIVDDIERQEKVLDRYDRLQKNPQYEYRDGQKMQVIF
ncbi:Polb [Symbiodinium natans]|uniref:DNA-directed DNA polymerase n=1 Tax=Symbiodinium natans TaxID=878477 RepID=A0A812I7B4_9DINO|nr:Polb [Symbiodinium natans]